MPQALLDNDRLEVFVAVADHGGFSAAARVLARSQPAVHAQVQTLARELGVALYRRQGRGIALTPAGREVAAHGRELVARSRSLRARLRGEADGPVTLAVGAGACQHLLGTALRAAVAARLTVAPLLGDAADSLRAVEDGHAALAVTVAPPRPTLASAVLRSVRLVVQVPSDHPLAEGQVVPLGALEGHALILPPAGRPVRDQLDAALLRARVSVRRPVAVRDWSLAAHLGSLGLGLPVLADFVPAPAGMCALALEEEISATYRLFWRQGALHGPAAQLAALIQQHQAPG